MRGFVRPAVLEQELKSGKMSAVDACLVRGGGVVGGWTLDAPARPSGMIF